MYALEQEEAAELLQQPISRSNHVSYMICDVTEKKAQ
jgi:hypothetical protein